LAKVLIPELKKRKIDLKAVDVILNENALDSNVNEFLMINSEINKISNTIIKAKDVVYFDNIFLFKSRIPSDPSNTPFTSNIPSSSSAPATDSEPRKSKKTMTHTSFGEDFFTYFVKGVLVPSRRQWTLPSLLSGKKPLTVRSSL